MESWISRRVSIAPVGALSVLPVVLTAVCFPLIRTIGGWGELGQPISRVIIVICGMLFTPALTCSVYSILLEESKLWGSVAVSAGVLAVIIEWQTLYFLEMGLALVPCTLVVMMVIAKRRNRNRNS